ncbi:MAG: WYL domain-containing protein [Cyanobacteriota bacterium]|nr:WYL domain-containing protein [Cyanobacteriota bacterium]
MTKDKTLDRLMVLIATLIKHPGVGCPEPLGLRDDKRQHHSALDHLVRKMRAIAASLHLDWSPNYPSLATLRKDLERLRDWGILDQRMYRWGYYLGTGVMTQRELKVAFNALESLAKYQGDPQVRQIYRRLSQRLRGFEFACEGEFFYPVRQNLNRAVDRTDPVEMLEKREHRKTLFHCIETLEDAIIKGQAVELFRHTSPHGTKHLGPNVVWPLQLVFYNNTWYLLLENCSDGCLATGRIVRFRDYCEIVMPAGRGIEAQKHSLDRAHQLLENGWGLYLGKTEQQHLELQGNLPLVEIKVRFFPPVSTFIAEGELRHPRQKLRRGPKDAQTGQLDYLDYAIALPQRSLNEFGLWLQRYGDKVQVISPPDLVRQHYETARSLLQRYEKVLGVRF